MNKYTKLFIIINLFFSIFFLKPNKIFALITNDEFTKSFIGKYHYVDYDGKYGDFEHFKRKSDGATAYCIEPRVSLAADSYKGYYSLTLSDMAKYVS